MVCDLDGAAYTLPGSFANRESKTGASALSTARWVAPIEGLNDVSAVCIRDAFSLILDRQSNRLFSNLHRNSDSGAIWTMLQRVQQDIGAQQKRIAAIDGHLSVSVEGEAHFNFFQFRQRFALMDSVLDDITQSTRQCL